MAPLKDSAQCLWGFTLACCLSALLTVAFVCTSTIVLCCLSLLDTSYRHYYIPPVMREAGAHPVTCICRTFPNSV